MPAALALLGACNAPVASRVEIAAHYVPACAPSAPTAPSRLELAALGDFDRSNESVVILASDAALARVDLPTDTLGAELVALDGERYWGAGTRDAHNRLPILLWPMGGPCALGPLGTASEWVSGASERSQQLLLVGLGAGGEATSYRVDLASGALSQLEETQGPRRARRAASLSELGDGLLLAGGLGDSGEALASAESFDPATDRFSGESVALARPRARHAALSLPGGSSLLVGGESERGEALASVELLTPGARLSRSYELLAAPRIAPRALLLGSDRVLVGGGYTRDALGARVPVASVELLSADLTEVAGAAAPLLPAALDRAFAPLGQAGALAVGGCEPGATTSDCIPCEQGCVSRAVFWIDGRGEVFPLEPLPTTLAAPAPELVAGAEGSPWLLANGRLGRFDPWLARSEAQGAAELGDARAALALRPGLFAWVQSRPEGDELRALLHSQRGPLAQDVAPFLAGTARGLVPERPQTEGPDPRLVFDPARGLELAGPAARVAIADTEYADFTLELNVLDGPPPLLELLGARGESAVLGGLECPWPEASDAAASSPARLRVRRTQGRVELARAAAEPQTPGLEPCVRALPERVRVALAGTRDGVSRIGSLAIRRSLE